MVTLSEAERSEEVLEYWRQLVCLQGVSGVDIKPETFFLSLRNAAKANLWDEVEAIIGMMQVFICDTYTSYGHRHDGAGRRVFGV